MNKHDNIESKLPMSSILITCVEKILSKRKIWSNLQWKEQKWDLIISRYNRSLFMQGT